MRSRDLAGRRPIGPASTRARLEPPRPRVPLPAPAPTPAIPTWEWVREWRQVAVRVRVLLAEREPVRWYRWQTAIDERTCPECGALQGHTWAEHQPAPAPPLHVNCRCRVVPDHIEWRTRLVPSWQVRLSRYPTWAWRRTGWQ